MPVREPTFKSALTSEVSSFIEKKRKDRAGGEDGDVEFLSVIDFIHKFKLFPYGLYPVQKFIVKLYYNMPLDEVNKTIKITDKFNSKILYEMTEKEYLKYLYDQGRCNISEQDGRARRELILCIGRRSGKSAMSAVFAAYEIYKLLRRGNPQAYYGMPGGSEIRVLCVANDKEQASIVYGDMQSHVEAIDYFKNSIANTTQTYLKFRTENDRTRFGDIGKASITATFKSSIAKGLRGRGVICAILDEIAFFVDDGRCLSLDSKILTDSGVKTLDDLLNESGADRTKTGWTDLKVKIIKENGESAYTDGIYFGGKRLVRSIHTRNGYQITGTPEHRIKVMTPDGSISWRHFSEIVPGDFIGIHRKTNFWSDSYYDISYIFEDIDINQKMIFDIHNDKITLFKEYLGNLLGSLIGRTDENKKYAFVEAWIKYFEQLGYDGHKKTPWIIFRSPKSVVAGYLRGLFSASEWFNKSNQIVLNLESYDFIRDVQLLLLNFGIICSIYKNGKNHTLKISDYESRKLFAKEIAFNSDNINLSLNELLKKTRPSSSKIPYQLNRIRRIADDVRISSLPSHIKKEVKRLTASQSSDHFKSDISYINAKRLISVLGNDYNKDVAELSYICDCDYFWDPVLNVHESVAEVADLRVPDGNQYISQGMTNHNSGAERIYSAITPSLAQFSPRDAIDKLKPIGPSEGRMILISSPDAKEGFFYRLYQQAMSGGKGASDMLVIQAPTWEVNPTLDSSYYEKEYYKNPNAFMTEHGAEFSDRVRGWIEDSADLMECVNPTHRPTDRGVPREIHFAGIDVGLVNDGTCIAISRIYDGKIELVYHEIWYAKRKWKEINPHLKEPLVPYAHTLQDQVRLDMSEIAKWFKEISRRFYIHKAIFDQWSGIVFEQELHKNGLTQFEIRNFFTSESSQMYQTFKMFIYNKQLKLYDYPRPESLDGVTGGRHSPLITELMELQATSGGKNIISVEAPKAPGKHDDMSDAVARSILLASEYIQGNPGILEKKVFSRAVDQVLVRSIGYGSYHRMRMALHGGNKLRTPPKIKPR